MINFFYKHYLKHDIHSQIKELYFSISMRGFATSMISIFEPIYLYNLYGSIRIVILFYTVLFFLYFFSIPLGAKLSSRYGFEHCIFYSTPFLIAYYLSLSLLPSFPFLLPISILLITMDKALLRPAYHADMAHYGTDGFRGREVGIMTFLESMATMAGPLIGGIVLTLFGFNVLFVFVSIMILYSVVPMLSTKETFSPSHFSYKKAMSNFLSPKGVYKRKNSLAFMAYGEELIVTTMWPIYMSIFLTGFYIIGSVTSIASFFTSLVKLYLGKLSDKFSGEKRKKWVVYNTIIYSFVDFCRPFVGHWFGIMSINFLSNTLKSGISYSYFTHVYSAGGTNKNFLDYAVFYEMSFAFGKFIVGFSILLLSFMFTGISFWLAVFIFAGIWSWFFTLLKF